MHISLLDFLKRALDGGGSGGVYVYAHTVLLAISSFYTRVS